jgi:thiol:disulfide interchange protein DsbD
MSEEATHLKGGSLPGVTVMGALVGAHRRPCVAAPLAGALLYIGQTGDAVLGGAALFCLGLGMGVPLLAVGLSAGTLLPKSGPWMEAVKKAFGVILLAPPSGSFRR